MGLIENFADFFGEETVELIHLYMLENEIFDEFEMVKNNTTLLFNFSVKYGILEIVRFLYERMQIEYDYDIITNYNSVLKSNEPSPTDIVAMTGSGNTSCNIQVWDKFTKNRNRCLAYLIDMKKYSKRRCNNKKFYYRFNPKYLSVVQ